MWISTITRKHVSSLVETDVSSLVEMFSTTSLEESIVGPGTVPHNTIGSSLRSSPFTCQKFMAAPAESSSPKRDVSSSEELLDATLPEETINAIPGILPHKTVDGSPSFFPFSCEKLVEGIAESVSVQTPQEQDVSSLGAFLDSTSSEELITASPQTEPCDQKLVAAAVESASMSSKGSTITSPQSVLDNTTDGSPPSASSPGSKILTRSRRNWYQVFYIRMDRGGSFCMYPNLGGPFQSIDEADDAIDRYLDELRHRAGCRELAKLSYVERRIHNCKYYLDGTPKRGPNKPKEDEKLYLVQALLHKYNEDHNIFGNHAHELEALVRKQWICENHRWYYHFNFTTKQNEGNDNSSIRNMFFAEVSHMQGESTLEVNCCCMIKHDENGHCYGCRNNGSPNMKHPDNIDAYTGGHLDGYLPFGLEEASSGDEEAEEERLRAKFKGLDDPKVWEKLRSLPHRRKVLVTP
ncbi:hypothetical protein BDA96_10G028500 [Sorghum bicolor]|uniref:DUF3615 domain-containing protein n=1 Tax=Sorghum bicolor TaxID=4558 RepID=A0A921PXA5_SORBI|nr:hypothetical protein BDA96_10G028500 [Sorghum bicolor]